jgi:DNA-binding NarL/FixJ family response regulator
MGHYKKRDCVGNHATISPKWGDSIMSTNLTQREKCILKLIADGLSNKEISKRLQISVATVENHIHSLYKKLLVSNRVQATMYALKNGIMDINYENDRTI